MDKFGIIGYPVAHSLSPRLFAEAYGGRWTYDLIEAPAFEECWQRFLDGGYRAINVTAPFKVDAFLKADIKAESAARVGAANIIVRSPEGLAAHNSDYLGVKRILSSLPGISTVCVVGYGGAGKAAFAAAQDSGLETSLLRHDGSSDVLRSALPSHQAGPLPLPVPRAARFSEGTPAGNGPDVIIYTLPREVKWIRRMRCRYLMEANYKDPCLQNSGIASEYIPGERWLLEQARCGFPLMTGEVPNMTDFD